MQLMHLSTSEKPAASLKTMFALRFLKAYSRINRYKSSTNLTSFSSSSISRRCQMIKTAADASMARAAGPKRAWSRSLLRKLLHRSRLRLLRGSTATRPKMLQLAMNTRKVGGGDDQLAGGTMSRTDKLRCLVPGGESMDLSILLDETANYIQCLTAQVHVMQGIADSLPPQ